MFASTPLPHGSWLAWGVLLTLVHAGLFLDVAGLPGLWLIVLGSIGYAWGTGFAYVGGVTIGLVLALAILAEGIAWIGERLAPVASTRTRPSLAGSLIGLAVGAGVGATVSPILGTLLLASIGGILGFYGIEWNTHPTRHHASRTTLSTAKNLIGIAMGAIAAIAGLPLSFG